MLCTNHKSTALPWGHLWPHQNLFSLCPEEKIPQEEPFEANTFPAKPRTLKALEVPGEEQRLSRQRVPEATSLPQSQSTAQGVVFLCCQGKTERISAAVLLPLLPACPKPLPWSLVSLAFSLCLALCPQEPTQL